MTAPLTDRERAVLEAVIETYVQTAEPAGSRTIAKRHQLGLSPASIRNTMSDLEEKGYLYHPHTSAGRIPTDLAYRVYVDFLMRPPAVAPAQAEHIRGELQGQRAAVEAILSRAAQVLGVLTNELGVAVSPTIDEACWSASTFSKYQPNGCCWCSRCGAERCARFSSRSRPTWRPTPCNESPSSSTSGSPASR